MNAAAGERVFVGLGGNLGAAEKTLRAAVAALRAQPGVEVVALSPLYRSAPVDAGGPDYVNAVVELRSRLEPEPLLQALLDIESQHGRDRPYHHAPRTLDLDLLLYGDRTQHTPALTLPHPRMHLRAFVLRPLCDIAPGLHIPGHGPALTCLQACRDQSISRIPE